MNEPPKPIRRKLFDIVGEAGNTRAGESRQKVLLGCNPGDPVDLLREPDNKADANAILVVWEGHDIGYIPRECASLLAPHIDDGRPHRAQVHCIRGGLPDYPNYGVEISIAWDGKECPTFRPLDQRQERSRQAKLLAAGRKRDAGGAFASGKSKGCLGAFALVAAPVGLAFAWLAGA